MNLKSFTPEENREYTGNTNYKKGVNAPICLCRMGACSENEREPAQPEIIILLTGGLTISIDTSDAHTVKPGTMVFLPPGCHALLRPLAEVYSLVLRIDYEGPGGGLQIFERLAYYGSVETTGFHTLELIPEMRTFVEGLVPFLENGIDSEDYFRCKVGEFSALFRLYYPPERQAAFFMPLLGRDTVFRHFVHKHIRNVYSVEELATLANMSRSGFFEKFKRIYNISPAVYLKNRKAEFIRNDLINTESPLAAIAMKYGFNTYEVFCKFVKKNLGHSPGQLRKTAKASRLLTNPDKSTENK